ncbi:MAG: ThiF family adenylyltransferase [Candidatus Bathyarchaeia archaeon]
MKVKAVIPSFKEVEFEAPDRVAVKDLKETICKRMGLEPPLTRLILDGSPLGEDEGIEAKGDARLRVIVDYYWARNLILWGLKAQRSLRSSSVLVAGAGALGCEVAENLAMLGVGELTIVDYDVVELSNLSRMAPYDTCDLGRSKASVLAEKIMRKHPYVSARALEKRLEEVPRSLFLDSDLLLSCLDNLPSRIYLASIAVKYDIPMVDAGIIGYQGRVHSYIPPGGACPACVVPADQYPRLAGLRNPCTPDLGETAMPSLPTSNKLVASIQSNEALKILLSLRRTPKKVIGEPLRQLLIIDLKYNRYTAIPVERNRRCIVCGEGGIAEHKSLRINASPEDLESPEKLLEKIEVKGEKELKGGEYAILVEDGPSFKRVGKDGWSEALELAKGKYIYIIFRDEPSGEYREALIKIPKRRRGIIAKA